MKLRICSVLVVTAVSGWVAASARGQDTNGCVPLPQTRLEAFDTNASTVIVRATAQIGTVGANAGNVSVKCREVTDVTAGERGYGIVVGITTGNLPEDQALVDYDELGPLLSGFDYLNRIDWSITSLQGFDAHYATKGGFRVVAFGSRHSGNIEFAVRNMRSGRPPLQLSRDQIGQLRSLIEQAKAKIEGIQKGG
jgi:hypothetical protein